MAHYVVWINHDEARLFKFTPGKEEDRHLKNKHHMNHHLNHQDQEKQNELKKYYKEVAESVKDATEILLMGPGMAKTEFKHYLDDHYKTSLAKKVIGVETSDKISDNQIRAAAAKFFEKYNLFN